MRMPCPPKPVALVLCALLVAVLTACTGGEARPTTLRVLASSELADLNPLLDELRRETGVELVMDHQGPVDAANALTPGKYQHDLAWLASDRYFQLRLKNSGTDVPRPLSSSTMVSPVVIGVKPETARLLRATAGNTGISWADIAEHAAAGSLRFAMADPKKTSSGLAALVGVATAAAGTGSALRLQDVTCDRLRGFRTGLALTADTASGLVDQFVRSQHDIDALIGPESALLRLNDSRRLGSPLEIVYPADGIVQSDYPLLLLDPKRRPEYDRVLSWLRRESTQKKIMETTLRRPAEKDMPRDPRLQTPVGDSLYFPDEQEIVDKLLTYYDDPKLRKPAKVIFLLDFSGSMRGARIAALRATFSGLSGADSSSDGKFTRFYRGEKVTVMRFGGQVRDERNFTINGQQDLDALRDFLATDDFDPRTAIWSSLDQSYRKAADITRNDPEQAVSIVLMTDGESNTGMSVDEFLRGHAAMPAAIRDVRTYTIRFGEADPGKLDRAARATGGHMVDANATSLHDAFKEIRGC